jgi:hypothetical protein
VRALRRLPASFRGKIGIALCAVLAAAITGATAPSASRAAMVSTMTSRESAQNLYNQLAANPVFGGQPFDPSRLAGMRWLRPEFGINSFRSRDSQWEQQGQTWPDDDPRWLILGKQPGNTLNRMHNLIGQGIFPQLHNQNRAERWGRSLFTLSHELGHNFTTPQYNFNENSADYWAKTHFKEYGRTLGLNGQQIRRMWRANNKFAGVKEAPQ